MSSNIWPDFKLTQNIKSPKNLVEKLGEGLEEKTDGLVRFESAATVKSHNINATFTFYSSRLGYGFPFLRVIFPINQFYPALIQADNFEPVYAENEEQLIKTITDILKAPHTVSVVERLMSLASEL